MRWVFHHKIIIKYRKENLKEQYPWILLDGHQALTPKKDFKVLYIFSHSNHRLRAPGLVFKILP